MFVNVTQKTLIPSVRNLRTHTSCAKFSSFTLQLGKFSILKKNLAQIFHRIQISVQQYTGWPHLTEQEEGSARLQRGTIHYGHLLETGSKLK